MVDIAWLGYVEMAKSSGGHSPKMNAGEGFRQMATVPIVCELVAQMRHLIAHIDPRALTADDQHALLDFVHRAMVAGGGRVNP